MEDGPEERRRGCMGWNASEVIADYNNSVSSVVTCKVQQIRLTG